MYYDPYGVYNGHEIKSMTKKEIEVQKERIFEEIGKIFPTADRSGNIITLISNNGRRKQYLVFDIPNIGNYRIIHDDDGITEFCPFFPDGISICDELNVLDTFEQYSHWLNPKNKILEPGNDLPPWIQQ